MELRLHRGGRTRAWIGARLGGDERLGDRVWRRCLHLSGGLVLLIFVVPNGVFGPVPPVDVLLAALAVLLALEALRYTGHLDLPTIRPHERGRVASFAYYGVGLVIAVLAFPKPIAVVAVLGAALVDPLLGELRIRGTRKGLTAAVGGAVYLGIALAALLLIARPPIPDAVGLAALGAVIAVAVEGPGSVVPLDDDLAMTVLPGAALAVLGWLAPAAWLLRP